MSEDILFERTGALGQVTLNRPKALNALTLEMIDALDRQLVDWAADDSVACALIRPVAGSRAFAAGGDIERLYRERGTAYTATFFWNEYTCNRRIHHYAKPYVAFMDGIVMGGGVGVSVLGSVRVASENTVFAMPETGIGFFPDVGGSWFLPRLPGRLGLHLALTGGRLNGAECCAVGLADVYIERARLDEAAAGLAALPPGADRAAVLTCLGTFASEPPVSNISERIPEIDRLFAGDDVAVILDRLAADGSEQSQKWAKAIGAKSPTSLKVAAEQLRRGAALDLDAALSMEFRLSQAFCADHDFFEGIRALIVDKDNTPAWDPPSLGDVSAERVASYFLPAAAGELNFDDAGRE